jgi:hypothetical protein
MHVPVSVVTDVIVVSSSVMKDGGPATGILRRGPVGRVELRIWPAGT